MRSRITGKLELGRASLVIRYVQPIDAGVYTCHISTEYGEADSQPARLGCEATGTIDGGSQLPGDKSRGEDEVKNIGG
ncbi:unnamed protein product [Protopolystoma xenopodis]|uniref:Immunoglobulin I-set domain-containing protein n=1 Tax=Protopolystoma xenopodis TaxID=117903 RepID=A0A448X167_9PLAT|nr:unnamed protein product [Protopolystoma xenopodis]